MQLNIKTDYAIRIILHLAGTKEIANAAELSEALGIPRTYVPKVVKGLIQSRIVDSREGMRGGYYLIKHPEEISLLDVFLSMEPVIKVSRCLKEDGFGARQRTSSYRVRKYYQELQRNIREDLEKKTIDEFL